MGRLCAFCTVCTAACDRVCATPLPLALNGIHINVFMYHLSFNWISLLALFSGHNVASLVGGYVANSVSVLILHFYSVLPHLGVVERIGLRPLFAPGGSWQWSRCWPAQQPQGSWSSGCSDVDPKDHCVSLRHHPHGHPPQNQPGGSSACSGLPHLINHQVRLG